MRAAVTHGKVSVVSAYQRPLLKGRANPMGNHAVDGSAHTASVDGV